MLLDRDEIARKVAENCKVIISTEDPVLAFVAMNSVILEKYSSVLTESLEAESQRSLVAYQMAAKQLASSLKSEVDREISQSLHDFRRLHTESYSQMHTALQEHINLVGKIRDDASKAKNLAWVGAFVAFLFLIGTAIVRVFVS